MKTGKLFLLGAAVMGAAAVSSCVKDGGEKNEPQAVRFTAGIEGQAVEAKAGTRASGTTWAAGDAIGVFMVNTGTPTVIDGCANKKYTTTAGDGNFSAATTADQIYYPTDGAEVDFVAYYPHQSGWTILGAFNPISIQTVQTTANQPTFDILTAKTPNCASGVPALTFAHKLTKLVLNTTSRTGADLSGMTVTIKGLHTEGTFHINTGGVGSQKTQADITPRTVTDGVQYDAIILPGTYEDGSVTFEFATGGKTYKWDIKATGSTTTYFLASQVNTYSVTINDEAVGPDPEQVTATSVITDWTPINRGSVSANE